MYAVGCASVQPDTHRLVIVQSHCKELGRKVICGARFHVDTWFVRHPIRRNTAYGAYLVSRDRRANPEHGTADKRAKRQCTRCPLYPRFQTGRTERSIMSHYEQVFREKYPNTRLEVKVLIPGSLVRYTVCAGDYPCGESTTRYMAFKYALEAEQAGLITPDPNEVATLDALRA